MTISRTTSVHHEHHDKKVEPVVEHKEEVHKEEVHKEEVHKEEVHKEEVHKEGH